MINVKIKLFVALDILKKVKDVINGKYMLYFKPLTTFRIITRYHILCELCFKSEFLGFFEI